MDKKFISRALSLLVLFALGAALFISCGGRNGETESSLPDLSSASSEEASSPDNVSSALSGSPSDSSSPAGTDADPLSLQGALNLSWHTRPKYDYEEMEAIGWSGIWMVKKNGKYGAIDADNNVILPVEYTSYYPCFLHGGIFNNLIEGDFENSKWASIYFDGTIIYWDQEGHCGPGTYFWDTAAQKAFLSATGDVAYISVLKDRIVAAGKIIEASDPYNNFESIRPAKYGIVYKDKLAAPLIYDEIKDNFNSMYFYEHYQKNPDSSHLAEWYHDLYWEKLYQNIYAAKKDGKAGYIDMDGKVLLPFSYEETDTFNLVSRESGRKLKAAAVKINGLWGFVQIDD